MPRPSWLCHLTSAVADSEEAVSFYSAFLTTLSGQNKPKEGCRPIWVSLTCIPLQFLFQSPNPCQPCGLVSTFLHLLFSFQMAMAGFVHCPSENEPDVACCFFCLLELEGWEPDDDPWWEEFSNLLVLSEETLMFVALLKVHIFKLVCSHFISVVCFYEILTYAKVRKLEWVFQWGKIQATMCNLSSKQFFFFNQMQRFRINV